MKRVHTVPPGTMPAATPRLSVDHNGAARNTTLRVLPTGRKPQSKCSLSFVYDVAKASGFRYPVGQYDRDSKATQDRDARCWPVRRAGVFAVPR